jgi:ATP-dependent RNA helicase DeaD
MIDRLLEQGYTSTDIASALIHLMQGDTTEPVKKTAKVRAEHIAANEAPMSSAPAPSAPVARPAPVRRDPPVSSPRPAADATPPSGDRFAAQKRTYDRKPRTGREPGYTPVSFNVGRAHLVTPADLVGKIAGVTRLPANVVGAIDIHEEHTHVDVVSEHVDTIITKLAGIRVKNQSLKLAIVPPAAE